MGDNPIGHLLEQANPFQIIKHTGNIVDAIGGKYKSGRDFINDMSPHAGTVTDLATGKKSFHDAAGELSPAAKLFNDSTKVDEKNPPPSPGAVPTLDNSSAEMDAAAKRMRTPRGSGATTFKSGSLMSGSSQSRRMLLGS